MNIAAIVILYNPERDTLANIASYLPFIGKLYIFDNSENRSFSPDELPFPEKIEYVHNGINMGIAARLNEGMKKAIAAGYERVLTMDQDSYFEDGIMERYLECLREYISKETVALFGPLYGRQQKNLSPGCKPIQIHELITSGTILHVELYRKVGEFDEELFIDSVDHDYCIRCKQQGFLLIQFDNIFLTHSLGNKVNASSIKTLFLVKKQKFLHNPTRCYYMYRNLLYLEKKFKGQPADLLVSVRSTAISNIKNALFYGRNSFKIFRSLLEARKDFKQGKMGKKA